jgi:hypothetical protein
MTEAGGGRGTKEIIGLFSIFVKIYIMKRRILK